MPQAEQLIRAATTYVFFIDNLQNVDITQTKGPTLKRNRENFDQFVKKVYRVPMTRGLKACYAYFLDKEVEGFMRGRMVEYDEL